MHFLHQVSPISHRDEGPLISEPRSSISHVSSLTHLGFWALTPARSVIYKKCSSLGFCFCFFLVVEVNVSLRRYQAKQMLKAAEQKSRGQHTVTVWFRKNLTSLSERNKKRRKTKQNWKICSKHSHNAKTNPSKISQKFLHHWEIFLKKKSADGVRKILIPRILILRKTF